ncbi:MAG: cystathionine beta-lyase, partial [Bacteroidota bacterium]
MAYNFDELIHREGTLSVKHGLKEKLFGRNDILPMWVADMDFKSPD